ncbi:MAG TPA: hypothetical protein VHK91_08565, partial [Flavisolibacter sp.]|nr:hypothetical protein [Flavisolibacter sp.]
MKYFLFSLLAFASFAKADAQGCVAIRNNGGSCTLMEPHEEGSAAATKGNWIFSLNSRYFKSFRHFVGTEEQKQRVEQGTEVINHVFSTELDLVRVINKRWSAGLFVPVINNLRSSLYEHDGKTRHTTGSFGVGDIRIAAYAWLIDPAKHSKGNIQLGLGIKLPTGDYRYQDFFYKNDSTRVLGPVDQSIQLGDGGTGISLEANTYLHLTRKLSAYFNGFYLSNPREQNGVSTARGGAPSATAIAYRSDVMSVPDQYMARIGASFSQQQFTFSGGVRLEGLPAEDLIGGSDGFRRPGYVVSVEP